MTFWLHTAIVVVLLVAFPLWDRRETQRLRAGTLSRVHSYQRTMTWMWLVSGLVLATSSWSALNAPPALAGISGLSLGSGRWTIVLALLAGLAVPVILAARSPARRAALSAQLAPLSFFLPQTATERRWFAGVCISAGVCEEIIFRGFLLDYFMAPPLGLGAWGSTLAAALIFGIDHGYQGWKGILSTGIAALVFTMLFAVFGSLWIPMVVHALIDFRALLVLAMAARSDGNAR